MITLKKELGLLQSKIISEYYFLQFFKNYKIQNNVTDKNTKFSAKCVHIVTHGLCEIFI